MATPNADSYEQLQYRLGRMYEKLEQAQPARPERFPPRAIRTNRFFAVRQDFRGGLSDDQIRGILCDLVYQIAHVKDLLKNWLSSKGQDAKKVENFINRHEPLQIIIDLANADKHGYPLRKPPRSRHNPRLGSVGRVLQLGTGSEHGPSSAVFTYDPTTGRPVARTTGGGSAGVVFTGDVVDSRGQRIGDVMETCTNAISLWERLRSDVGVT